MMHIRTYKLLVIVLGISYFGAHEASEMRLTHESYLYPYRSLFQSQHVPRPVMRGGELGASTIVSPSRSGHSMWHTDIQQAKDDIADFVQQVSNPSYLEQSIAGQTAHIDTLSHMGLEANRVRLTNELSELRKNAVEIQRTVDQMLSQMGLSFLTTALTPEQERRVDPRFVASYYCNKSLLQSLNLSIAKGEKLLQYNEACLRSVELELSKAEEGFRRQIPDTRLYERSSSEMLEREKTIKELEKVISLQKELIAIKKAIKENDHFYIWGRAEKVQPLKHREIVLEAEIKEMGGFKYASVGEAEGKLAEDKEELNKLREIHAYKGRCAADYKKIQAMYQKLVERGAIRKDDPLFELVAGESFLAHELSAQRITPLTPAAREWLGLHHIDAQVFESLKGDTTQKLLMNRLCEIINHHGEVAQTFGDTIINEQTAMLAQDIVVAEQMIKKGTPYQAFAWTGFSEVVDHAVRININGAKGILRGEFYNDKNFDPQYTADKLLEVCGFCLNACKDEPRTVAKLKSMCIRFPELPRDQQIKEAAPLFASLLSPDPKLAIFENLDKALSSLHSVMQREVQVLERLSKLEKSAIVNIHGVDVPEQWKEALEIVIADGRITTAEDVNRWVEYLEAPLLSPLNQALVDLGKELASPTTIVQSAGRTVPVPSSQAMLEVERKERAAHSEIEGLSTVSKVSMINPERTAQLIPVSEAQKAQIKQLHDHYQGLVPSAQSKFVPFREQRIKALADAPSTEATSRTYQLLPVSEQWVREKGVLHTDAWKVCKGSALNQEIHSELVAVVNEAGKLHYAHKNEHVHVVTDSLAKFVMLAKEANERNAIPEACRLADACWSLLDYGCAIGEGVVEGASRVGHMVTHPVETVMGTGQLVHNLAYLLCEYEAIGDVTCSQGAKAAERILDAHARKINDLEKALNHALSTTSGRDFVKAGTAMATEMWLTGKITAATKPLFDMAKNRLAKATGAIWDGAKEEVILAGEMEIRLVAETRDHIAAMQADKAKGAGVSVSKAATKATEAEVKVTHAAQEAGLAASTSTAREVRPTVKTAITETESVKAPRVTLGKITPQNIEEGVRRIMNDPNKITHIFEKSEHGFDRLLKIYGNQEGVIRAILTAACDKLPTSGFFEDLFITVGEHIVCIRGNVIDGVPRIGTMFLK